MSESRPGPEHVCRMQPEAMFDERDETIRILREQVEGLRSMLLTEEREVDDLNAEIDRLERRSRAREKEVNEQMEMAREMARDAWRAVAAARARNAQDKGSR